MDVKKNINFEVKWIWWKMDKKIPKIKREKVPERERDNDVSNSSSISISGPTIPQRPYKLGIL